MHWRNSDFQYAYFIAGRCHTADEAYRKLSECLEDRQRARETCDAKRPLFNARRLRAKEKLKSDKDYERLEGRAEFDEVEIDVKYMQVNYDQCVKEIESLEKMLKELEKYRKYKDKPLDEANQLIQREEWKHELILRAKEFMLTSGTIPADHLRTMLNHPDFKKEIAPAITDMNEKLKKNELKLEDLSQESLMPQLENKNIS